jgi:hypothetical protein
LAHEPLLTAVKERFGSIEDRLFKLGIGAGRRRFRQPRQRRTDRYGRREREASWQVSRLEAELIKLQTELRELRDNKRTAPILPMRAAQRHASKPSARSPAI